MSRGDRQSLNSNLFQQNYEMPEVGNLRNEHGAETIADVSRIDLSQLETDLQQHF